MKLIKVLKLIESTIEYWRKHRKSGILTFRIPISKGGIRDLHIDEVSDYTINQTS